MKRQTTLFFLAISLILSANAQSGDSIRVVTIGDETFTYGRPVKEELSAPKLNLSKEGIYQQKAIRQRNAGYGMLAGGLLSAGIGFLICNESFEGQFIGGAFIGVGGVLTLCSIPMFITSAVYRGKARVAMKKQSTSFGMPPGRSKALPALSLSLSLGR